MGMRAVYVTCSLLSSSWKTIEIPCISSFSETHVDLVLQARAL